jgi:hypothetical protein
VTPGSFQILPNSSQTRIVTERQRDQPSQCLSPRRNLTQGHVIPSRSCSYLSHVRAFILLAETHIPERPPALYIITGDDWSGQQSLIISRLCIHRAPPVPWINSGICLDYSLFGQQALKPTRLNSVTTMETPDHGVMTSFSTDLKRTDIKED